MSQGSKKPADILTEIIDISSHSRDDSGSGEQDQLTEFDTEEKLYTAKRSEIIEFIQNS